MRAWPSLRLALALALLPLASCDNTCYDERPRDAGLYDGEIFVEGMRRTYVLFIPKSYDGRKPMPLIINCPNTGVSALEELHQSGLVENGRGDNYIVVTLNAVNKAFNVLEDARASAHGPDDVQFARTLYRYLASRLCIDTAQVYATGISRGGRFASRLASEMSDIISAIGVVSGLRYPQPNNASRPIPVIAFHGTADPINPYEDGGPTYWQTGVENAVRGWASFNGCRRQAEHRIATSIVKLVHYECTNNADVILYKIEGGGHTWPGSTFYYTNQGRLRLGPATLEISASDMMWDFWRRTAAAALDRNYWKHQGIKAYTEIELASIRAEESLGNRLRTRASGASGRGSWARLWAGYASSAGGAPDGEAYGGSHSAGHPVDWRGATAGGEHGAWQGRGRSGGGMGGVLAAVAGDGAWSQATFCAAALAGLALIVLSVRRRAARRAQAERVACGLV